MGRRFDSYFQETEIAQLVRAIHTDFKSVFIARKGSIRKKVESFLFDIRIYFLEMNLNKDQNSLKTGFKTLVDD